MKLRNHHLAVLVACTTALACGRSSDKAELFTPAETMEQAVWANNGFENDANNTVPSSWTLSNYLNTGIQGSDAAPPTSVTQLNLGSAGAGVNETLVVGTATMQQNDPDLGTGQAFRYPRFGQRSARINYLTPATNGKNKNVNMLRQTMSVGQADVDPTDGQIHVRVVLAPVLENPAHGFTQQPYFYVELTNVTRNSSLYQTFNLAGQQSAPWNNTTSLTTGNPTQWQDWQMLDILAAPGTLTVGEQVQLTVVASGCSLGGHFGRVYLDGVGASVPGPYTWATAPQFTKAGSQLTYTVNYSNGDATPAIGASINFDVPANSTFASTSLAACSTPAVGSTGTLVCPLGTLQPGGAGSFTVTVNVGSGATGTIKSGTYSITAVNGSRLLGPAVNTKIVPASTTFADLVVTPVTSVTAADWGSNVTYAFKVANLGPTDLPSGGMTVSDVPPAQFTNVAWTCALTAGSSSTSSCNTASGTGNIATHPKLASGAEVTYTVTATIAAGSGNATVSHDPNAAVVSGSSDPNTYNNDSLMVTTLGTPDSLTVTKTNVSYGKVTTYPNVLTCDANCVTASGNAADGTSVQLNAVVQNGGTFLGWGGACAGSGNSVSCSVAMNGNQAVYANFGPPPTPGPASALYIYSGNNQYGRISSAYPAAVQAFVSDANGTPVPGVSVTFTPPTSGATLNPNTPTAISTNASGIASLTANANAVAGAFTLTATATGTSPTLSYSLTNVSSPNSLVYIVGGNTTTAQSAVINSNFTTNPTVRVLDASGNPVPGATVSWASNGNATTNANSILSAPTSVSNAQGYASIGVRANGSVGPYTVSATIAGLNTVAINLNNTAATPAAIRVVSGTPQTTNTTGVFNLPLVVQVSDGIGNPVPGATVTWTVPSTGASASLSTATITTDATGQGNIIATANGTSGAYQVSAAASGAGNANFMLTNDGSQYVTVQSGGNQSTGIGTAFASLVALVTDRNGAPVANANVTFTAPTTGARAIFTGNANTIVAVTNPNGLATVSATASTTTGSYSVNATTPSAASPATYSLTNTSGAASAVTVSSGGTAQSAVVGAPFATALAAQVNDASGNGVPNVTVTFVTPSSNPNAVLSSTTAVTDSTGKASITATAGQIVGTYNVTATAAGVSGTLTFGALTNTVGPAALLNVVSGNYQSTAINTNTTLPLTVSVTDSYGNPVSGSTVGWTSSTPTMGVVTASSTTGASGNANTTVTAKAATGSYTVTAAVTGLTSVVFNLATSAVDPNGISATAGTPQSIAINSNFTAPLTVHVQGASNPNLANVWVTWTGPSGNSNASINPVTLYGLTNVNGNANVIATANSVASSTAYTVGAVASKFATAANFSLTNTTGTTGVVKLISGTGQSTLVGTAFSNTVNTRLTDAGGNPIANANVTFAAQGTATTANATVASQVITTDAAGNANASFTANNYAGNFNVIVTPPSGTAATFTLTNTPAAASKVVVSSGSGQTAVVNNVFGSALTALVTDTYGNPVGAGITVTFANPSSNPNAIPNSATAKTNSSGMASISAKAGLVTGSYNIVASIPSGASTASFALTNQVGPAAGVLVASGSGQSVVVTNAFGASLVATVVDAYNNAVGAGFTVNFASPSSAGVAGAGLTSSLLQNTNVTTNSSGQASVSANANTVAGTYTVVARYGGSSTTGNFSLTNLPGTATKVAVSSGNAQSKTVGVAFDNPLAVNVTDNYNNLVGSGVTVTYATPSTNPNATLPGGAGTATATTNASGVASLSATAGQVVGSYSVTATVPSGTQQASFGLTNVLGAPSKVSVVSGSAQNQNVNVNFGASLVAQVTDVYGNPVGAGVTVNLGPPSSGATAVLPGATASTDSSGKITVTAKAGTVTGSYNVTASVPSGSQSASFALTNLPGTATTVSPVSGSGQSQNANTAFASPLVAKLVDQYGNALTAGYVVNFSAPTPGAGVATATVAASATTDPNGQVSLPATAGTVAGSYNVTAAYGSATSASFALTNLAGSPVAVALVGGAGDNQSKAVGQPFDANLLVQVNDAYGNAVGANVLVTYTAPSTGATATLGSSGNANTNSAGRVSLPASAGTAVGSYTVTAAITGGTSSATFHLTNLLGALTKVSVVSGSGQTATVGSPFASLVAQVSDAYGNPAGSGTTVTFATPAEPNATLAAGTATTTSSGQASVGATAGHIAGNYNIIASISGGTSTATFALINSPGAATAVSVVSGDPQSQTITQAFSNPLVAQVADQYGNAVGANVTVSWTVPSTNPNASLSATSGPTDANGKVSVTATAGKRTGAYNVTAGVTGGTSAATFHLTNQPGAPATVAAAPSSSGQSATVNTAFTNALGAVVTDAQGNPVPGVTVTFAPSGTAPTASLSSLTAVTDANGLAPVTATAGTQAGAYSVTASAGSATTASFALTNTAGAATALAVVQGNDQNTTVNTAFADVVVQVTDTYNNNVPNAAITVTSPSSGATASLSATPGATDANGKTTLTLNANTVAGSYTVNLATPCSPTPCTAPATALRLTNVPGPAAKIAATAGDSQHATVGAAFATPLGVTVTDAYGNPLAGLGVTVTVPSSDPTAAQTGTPGATDASGSTTVALNAGTKPGSYTVSVGLTVPVTGVGNANFTLTNDVGPVAAVTASSGSSTQQATVNTAFSNALVAVATDSYGNPVANANITFTGPSSGAGVTPASAVLTTDANGLVSLPVTANKVAGAYSVSAAAAVGTPTSFSLTNNPGAVAKVVPVPGSSLQSTQVGTAFATTLVMQVSDSYDNPISGATVTVTPPSTGASASLSALSNGGVTDGQGQISVTATANTSSGTYSVVAAPANSSVTGAWVLTNTAAPASAIAVRSGDNQSATLNSALLAPLVAKVTDQYGNPVSGVTVTFVVTPDATTGASLTPASTTYTTNAGGLAGLTGTANGFTGDYTVTATAGSLTPAASFTVHNVASGNLSFTKVSGDNQSAQVTTNFAQPLVMELHDAANNPIAGVLVAFTGSNASLSATALSTDANGLVSLNVGALSTAGPVQVTASVDAATNANFTLTATPGAVVALRADAASGTQAATSGQGFSQPLGVTAVDAWGNPVAGTSVTFAAPTSGATAQLSGTTVTTDANGRAQVTATAGSVAGSFPITATLAGAGTATASYTLTNLAGAPSVFQILSGDGNSATVHTAFAQPFKVQLLDANGNPVAGVAVTFAAPASGPTATPTATVTTTDAQGYAQLQATAGDVAGTYAVSVSAIGAAAPAVLHVTNLPGTAVALVTDPASASQSALPGHAFVNALGVTVVDAYGNPVPGATVTYTVPSSGATATLTVNGTAATTVTTDASGHAQITGTAGSTTGDYQVTAQVQGVSAPSTWNLTNSSDTPLIVLSASNISQSTKVGTAFQPLVIYVHDAFGGPVPDAVVNFSGPLAGAGATFAASLISDANGLVSLPITANTVSGSYTLSATVPNGSTPLVFNLTNTANPATQLILATVSAPQSALVGHPFSVNLLVRVLDADGNPVVGAVVNFTPPASGATVLLSATSVVTDAQGYAQVVAIAGNSAGLVNVGISVSNTGLTANVQLTNLDSAGDTLSLESGDGQSATANAAFAAPLVFKLRGSDGLAHASVVVSFTSAPAGLTLSSAQATTDGAGVVELSVTAGGTSGAYTVTATAPNTAAPAVASLTVAGVPTTTSLTLSKTDLDPGDTLQLTAQVTASSGTAQGKVDFYVDNARITTVPVDGNGQATAAHGVSAPGAHNTTAVFVPDVPYGASQSAPASFKVNDYVISGGGCSALAGSSPGMLLALAGLVRLLRRKRAQ